MAWPSYAPSYKSKSGGKVVINWKNFRKQIKDVRPKAKWVELQYGTNADFKNAVKKTIKIKDLNKKTVLRNLNRNKNYYFRVRLSNGKKDLFNWSRTIKIKTK